jgi:CDGSH-type Zn-finger protein/uncharacterized Fe-S cluster protein YjdI
MAGAIEGAEGKTVVIRFDGSKCIHSRNCVLGRPDVFVPNVEGEWIHPDRASPEAIAILAHTCPSGAITYARRDGGANEPAPEVNVVRVRENGPLAFNALLTVDGTSAGLRATLCRCGASKNKPYCDASHTGAGFTATGEPAAQTVETLPARDGPLAVQPIPNGPLHVVGALEVVTGTGHTIGRAAEAWLCRCGASGKKPYCDGSHKKVGFRSDV